MRTELFLLLVEGPAVDRSFIDPVGTLSESGCEFSEARMQSSHFIAALMIFEVAADCRIEELEISYIGISKRFVASVIFPVDLCQMTGVISSSFSCHFMFRPFR